ncbi:hypothetical protein [Oceanobacter antarcticus]|uniref:Uncharacterized protein n=2 Tax=Oceanospirillaceae TaxID=135620 RepID=A0ABW8NIW2_9GAMM|tara:strand:+ start:7914 stop:8168 length:255 start_codon:yes stop_codon:yes gene_type:complete
MLTIVQKMFVSQLWLSCYDTSTATDKSWQQKISSAAAFNVLPLAVVSAVFVIWREIGSWKLRSCVIQLNLYEGELIMYSIRKTL